MLETYSRYERRDTDLHRAVGRLLFRVNGGGYMCSGTLVEGPSNKVIISTAAHCIYDIDTNSFAYDAMFIPGQDDGQSDTSDRHCANDPYGCYYPTIGVISKRYQQADFVPGLRYDYGFYVGPDSDPGDKNRAPGGPPSSLTPMEISFEAITYGKNVHLFGYPGNRDPQFMYTHGMAERAPINSGAGTYVECSGLSGGASGGPWTHPKHISMGRLVVSSVNSWGWSNGDPGMGSPPFHTGGAQCVYDAAVSASLNGGNVVENCPS